MVLSSFGPNVGQHMSKILREYSQYNGYISTAEARKDFMRQALVFRFEAYHNFYNMPAHQTARIQVNCSISELFMQFATNRDFKTIVTEMNDRLVDELYATYTQGMDEVVVYPESIVYQHELWKHKRWERIINLEAIHIKYDTEVREVP